LPIYPGKLLDRITLYFELMEVVYVVGMTIHV